MTDIDLNFLAKQLDRALAEIGSFRDDMNVMMAILQRVDHTTTSMARQLTRRVEARVAKLEKV